MCATTADLQARHCFTPGMNMCSAPLPSTQLYVCRHARCTYCHPQALATLAGCVPLYYACVVADPHGALDKTKPRILCRCNKLYYFQGAILFGQATTFIHLTYLLVTMLSVDIFNNLTHAHILLYTHLLQARTVSKLCT